MVNDMTKGSVSKSLIRFTVPLILSGLLQQLYSIADSVILGNFVGDNALATVGVTTPLFNICIYVIIAFVSGYTILLSQLFGAKEHDKIVKLSSTVVVLLISFTVIILVPAFIFKNNILALLNTPADVFSGASSYLTITLLGVPFIVLYNLYSSMLRGVGNSKTPLNAIIISSLSNVVLDLLFVAVWGWGVRGAAFATLIAQIFSGLYLVVYTRNYDMFKLHFKKEYMDKPLFMETVRLGTPRVIQSLLLSLGAMILQRIMNGFGPDVVTSITTAYKVDSLTILPIVNISTAISIFVGQNVGAGDMARAREGLKRGTQLTLMIGVTITAIFVCFGKTLMGFFGVSDGIAELGARFFHTCAIFYPIMGLQNAIFGYLQGVKDVTFCASISIFSLIVRVAASYLLMPWLQTDVIAVAECLAWTSGAVLCVLRYRHIRGISN